MNLTKTAIWLGTVLAVGSFGYKMVQKSRGRVVPQSVDSMMYLGIGAVAVSIAFNTATGKQSPIKGLK